MRSTTCWVLICHLLLACDDGGQAGVDAGSPGNVDAAPGLDGQPGDTDAAPIDMDAAVGPECPYGHIDQGGSCVEARHLNFVVTGAGTNACFYEAGGVDNSALLVAEMTYGPCKVTVLRHGNSNLNTFAGGAGTLTITGSDTLTLEPDGLTPGCYRSGLPTAPVLAGATELHFLASGGADVAALDETLPVPEPIAAVIGPVMVGQSVDLTWTGSGGDDIEIFVATNDFMVAQSASMICTVQDNGAFTIPSEATARLFSGDAYVSVTRARRRHIERDGLVIELAVLLLDEERQAAALDPP
jgi:hypothetical protein